MCFKIDWASLIAEVNLPFLLCFSLYLRVVFQVRGAYIWRGDLTERLLRYRFEGLILRILRYANSKCFSLRSNLSNDDIISAQNPGLKMGIDFRDLV